jgi:HSP20 family protein
MYSMLPVFDGFFKDLRSLTPLGKMDDTPSMDVYKRNDQVFVHIDLPGVALEDVSVSVENGWVSVKAERTYSPEPGDTVLLSERSFGRFERKLKIAGTVDPSNVKADLVDGVLTIVVENSKETESSNITIGKGAA